MHTRSSPLPPQQHSITLTLKHHEKEEHKQAVGEEEEEEDYKKVTVY